jgi:hypothetical protein
MSKNTKTAANDASNTPSVTGQIFEAFYQALEQKPEFKDIAARFRAEPDRSDTSLKKILFGGEE